MPLDLFEQVRQALRGSGPAVPGDPEEGRRQALAACHQARERGAHQDATHLEHTIHEALALNQALASQTTRAPSGAPTQETHPMPTRIRIDDTEHVFEVVPAEVRTLLDNIAFVDGEIARLQAQLAAMQAARRLCRPAEGGAAEGVRRSLVQASKPGTGQRPGASASPASQATTASSAGGAKP